ncbi:MAG: hypothetical protein K6E75_01555 [Lachnospiraceae bacterium]|nr:hypothetical protein [Lachnospiraceae bacterium]
MDYTVGNILVESEQNFMEPYTYAEMLRRIGKADGTKNKEEEQEDDGV